MKRLFLILFFINLLLITTYSDAFDSVPFNTWPYYLVHDLETKGYIFINQDSPIKGSMPATRIDFAKELVSFFEELEDPNNIIDFSEKELINIMRLINEFHEEFEFLGINTLKVKTNYGLDEVLQPFAERQGIGNWEQETGNRKQRTVNGKQETGNGERWNRKIVDSKSKHKKYHTKAQAMMETYIASFSAGPDVSTSRIKVDYNVNSKDIKGEFIFEAGIDRDRSRVEDAPIVKKLVYENNKLPFIDNMKIGRFNLNTGNGILFDNSSNNGIVLKKDNLSLYMFQEDVDANKLPKASGSVLSNGINAFGLKYNPFEWIEFFYFNIDDIDMNSNGIKDNTASPLVFSMKKNIAGFHTELDLGIYNYEYTLPTIGMLDTTYTAFDLTLKKFFKGVLGTLRFSQREKGFAPIIDSNDFYYGTDIKKPLYTDLGFNGNVNDLFLKLEKDDLALVIENMSQETGGAEADIISLIYNKKIMRRYLLESSVSSLSLSDPSGVLGGVYPDVRGGFTNSMTNNIDSTLLKLSIGYEF